MMSIYKSPFDAVSVERWNFCGKVSHGRTRVGGRNRSFYYVEYRKFQLNVVNRLILIS